MKDVSATLFNACDERSKTARGGHAGSFVHALVTKTAVEFIAHKLAPRPASFYEGTSNIVTERFELFASFELFPVLFNKRGKGEWFTRLGQILLCTVRRASATFISRIDPGSPTSGSRRSFVFRWHTLRNSTIKVGIPVGFGWPGRENCAEGAVKRCQREGRSVRFTSAWFRDLGGNFDYTGNYWRVALSQRLRRRRSINSFWKRWNITGMILRSRWRFNLRDFLDWFSNKPIVVSVSIFETRFDYNSTQV